MFKLNGIIVKTEGMILRVEGKMFKMTGTLLETMGKMFEIQGRELNKHLITPGARFPAKGRIKQSWLFCGRMTPG